MAEKEERRWKMKRRNWRLTTKLTLPNAYHAKAAKKMIRRDMIRTMVAAGVGPRRCSVEVVVVGAIAEWFMESR